MIKLNAWYTHEISVNHIVNLYTFINLDDWTLTFYASSLNIPLNLQWPSTISFCRCSIRYIVSLARYYLSWLPLNRVKMDMMKTSGMSLTEKTYEIYAKIKTQIWSNVTSEIWFDEMNWGLRFGAFLILTTLSRILCSWLSVSSIYTEKKSH